MLRNVEIKAKVRNLDDIVSKAKKLSNSEGTWIKQDDVFFRVPQGRLKLRTFEVSCSNTIQVCNFLLNAGVMFVENVTRDKTTLDQLIFSMVRDACGCDITNFFFYCNSTYQQGNYEDVFAELKCADSTVKF